MHRELTNLDAGDQVAIRGARRREVLCRAAIYGSPILAAAVTISAIFAARATPAGPLISALTPLIWINAALAAVGSAVATVLLSGREGVRVAGAFAYGLLSFLVYALVSGLAISALSL